jgi:hypothetical protein
MAIGQTPNLIDMFMAFLDASLSLCQKTLTLSPFIGESSRDVSSGMT